MKTLHNELSKRSQKQHLSTSLNSRSSWKDVQPFIKLWRVKMLGNKFVEQADRVDQCDQWFCLFVAFVLHVRYAAVSARGSAFAQGNCSKWHRPNLKGNALQSLPPERNEMEWILEFSACASGQKWGLVMWWSFPFRINLWAEPWWKLSTRLVETETSGVDPQNCLDLVKQVRDFDACRV